MEDKELEHKLDLDFSQLGLWVVVILVGAFARFIDLHSHALELGSWALVALGTVMALRTISQVLTPNRQA